MTYNSPSLDLFLSLPLEAWQDTYTSLHMWTQIVGKIRLALSPMANHWWHTTLSLTSRGMTTSSMPYNNEVIQIEFDFIEHVLHVCAEQQRFGPNYSTNGSPGR